MKPRQQSGEISALSSEFRSVWSVQSVVKFLGPVAGVSCVGDAAFAYVNASTQKIDHGFRG